MSNYSDPITATGSLITFDAPQGGVVDALTIPITPTQNLNGYSKPWAAGAGKNKAKLTAVSAGVSLISDLTDNSVTVYNTTTSAGYKYKRFSVLSAQPYAGQTLRFSAKASVVTGATTPRIVARLYEADGTTTVGSALFELTGTTFSRSITLPDTIADGVILCLILYSDSGQGGANEISYSDIMLEVGSTATDFEPFANVCPITGLSSLSVYVSPTQNQADATTYAEDWTSQAGTVYAGSIEAVSGSLKVRPHYASYNGETLVGPWLSSLDEYAEGATPTTGSQVVDLGGAESSYSITPPSISMLTGANNVWASSGAVLTLVYRLIQTDWANGSTSIGKLAASLTVSAQFNGYSKVIVQLSEETWYEAGNETGRTLTIDCPWGTQAMANNLLALLEGFQYQPYEATDALLDPAAELGDGLTVNGVYGGIFDMKIRANVLHSVDVSSPHDEEIEHEYNFVPATERRVERKFANVQSQLSVQSDQISAKVDRDGGDPSSVSWEINADNFKIAVDGADVLVVDDNGLTVHGDGTFDGIVQAGNIAYGGDAGTFNGAGLSGGSVSRGKTGFTGTLNNADSAYGVTSGASVADLLRSEKVTITGSKGLYYNDGSSIKRVVPVSATFYIKSQGSQVEKSFTFLGFSS